MAAPSDQVSRAARLNLPSRTIPLGLGALCLVLAFLQRPGLGYDDTRVELSANPTLFVHRVSALWSPTFDLGHVHSGQFVGYLFPMGPYYALASWVGLPTWIAQRLWLGALLALAAWGAVRLVDELFERRRGAAHLTAGLLYAINPYVVVYVSRGSGVLLAYTALPWLLVAVHRGLRTPRAWRWPALAGLVLTAAGGGINAAVLVWVALAPVALVIYEGAVLRRPSRDLWSFSWRAALCSLLVSLWWLVPVALQARYGSDFLRFTEQPANIFGTTSLSETLRLLGYWVSYFSFGVGRLQPTLPAIGTYLHNPPVEVASFLIPLLAFGGLIWTRRFTYAPFLGLLGVGAALVMAAGFPLSSPLSHGLTSLYYELSPVQFLRTTYKAAPLLAISIACLAGSAVSLLMARARSSGIWLLRSRLPAWAPVALVALPALWAVPLLTGRAIDRPLAYGHVPSTWTRAIAQAQRTTPPDRRLMVLPGELFGWYRWGGTWTSIAPALAQRPVLIREITRYADPRAAQLQDSVDDQLGQGRLVPGQLAPLLGLMGVGQVLVANDGSRTRSGAVDPARLAQALLNQAGFARPQASFGRPRAYAPDPGFGGELVRVPDLQLYDTPGAAGPGIVRVHPASGDTILDGDAHGVVELAATGGLDNRHALQYAADLTPGELRRRLATGASLVITDSNRRREVVGSELEANHGVTLGPGDAIPRDQARYELFPRSGPRTETVSTYSGLRYLRSPESPGFGVFPQNRAFAAFDGRLDTAWIANAQDPQDRYLEFALAQPRSLAAIRVHPHADGAGRTQMLGVSINGGVEHPVRLASGWNRLPLFGLRVRTLRLRVLNVTGGLLVPGLGGLDEVQVPGLKVKESLRMPQTLASATRGLSLSQNPVQIVLERARADFPYRPRAPTQDLNRTDETTVADPERGIERDVLEPESRPFVLDGWASVSPTAPDHLLDRLAGLSGNWQFDSSGRFEGVPARRASAAFDGNSGTAWVAPRAPFQQPWLQWRSPRPIQIRRLRLLPGPPEYAFPTRVRISTELGAGSALRVARDGSVLLAHPVRAQVVRIDILGVRPPQTRELRHRQLRAVAIGEVLVPGLRPPHPRSGPRASFSTACGALRVWVAGTSMPGRAVGLVHDLDAGQGLRMLGCGPAVHIPAGWTHISAGPGEVMQPDFVRLRSPARQPARELTHAPAVLSPGRPGNGHQERVRLSLHGPAWLVLGQSYSRGWRARCQDGRGHELRLDGPVPIDGFANGWRVPATCRAVRFSFAPQTVAATSYAIGLIACFLAVALLVAGALRRRRAPAPARSPSPQSPAALTDPLIRLSWPASIIGAAAALLVGATEAWRVGVAMALVALVLAREGLSVVRLLALGAIALAALPALYVLKAPPTTLQAAFEFSFPAQHLTAHWVAFLAVVCVGVACALQARRLRGMR